jgi:hypothetical protein
VASNRPFGVSLKLKIYPGFTTQAVYAAPTNTIDFFRPIALASSPTPKLAAAMHASVVLRTPTSRPTRSTRDGPDTRQ